MKFSGQFFWHDDCIPLMRKLYADDLKPIPDSPKLAPYNTRRFQFLVKLSMVSCLSRTSNIVIEPYDVERARHWLLSAEATMPNIFSSMSLKTDMQLIEELHILATREWKKQNFADLPQSMLHGFLQQRVYAERIPKIIDQMIKSHLIQDKGGEMFKPLPRMDLGISMLKEKPGAKPDGP
jgi:hypothetical protein